MKDIHGLCHSLHCKIVVTIYNFRDGLMKSSITVSVVSCFNWEISQSVPPQVKLTRPIRPPEDKPSNSFAGPKTQQGSISTIVVKHTHTSLLVKTWQLKKCRIVFYFKFLESVYKRHTVCTPMTLPEYVWYHFNSVWMSRQVEIGCCGLMGPILELFAEHLAFLTFLSGEMLLVIFSKASLLWDGGEMHFPKKTWVHPCSLVWNVNTLSNSSQIKTSPA